MNTDELQNPALEPSSLAPGAPGAAPFTPTAALGRTQQKKKPPPKKALASFMSQWFSQYYRSVTVAACLALLAAGYLVLLSPKLSSARVISGEQLQVVAAERRGFEQTLAYAARLGSGQTTTALRTVQEVDDLLPTGPATPQILTSLETIARESGVVIDGIELVIPEEEAKKDAASEVNLPSGVSFVEVTLSIAASPYEVTKTLLKNIEANIRLMDVIAVVYSPNGKSYTVILRAYYLQP